MGAIKIKEMFIFRNNKYDHRGSNKLHQPACNSRFIHRSYLNVTSRLWNNVPDCVRRAPSLTVFKTMLNNLNLTIGVECYCNFCTQFGFLSSLFIAPYLFILCHVWIYSYLARSRLNESCTHPCNVDKENTIPDHTKY